MSSASAARPLGIRPPFYTRRSPFDYLVLAIGSARGAGPFIELDLEDLRAGFEQKFWGYVVSLRTALPQIRERGSITLVGAISAHAGIPGSAGLAAINGAVEALVRPLAVELAPIRVNAVSPGAVDTPWWT